VENHRILLFLAVKSLMEKDGLVSLQSALKKRVETKKVLSLRSGFIGCVILQKKDAKNLKNKP
jgi:hypothetical protein